MYVAYMTVRVHVNVNLRNFTAFNSTIGGKLGTFVLHISRLCNSYYYLIN